MKYLGTLIVVIVSIAIICSPPLHVASNTYAALGDSVTAGAGLSSGNTLRKRST
jgi:hypothetical protein